MKQIVYRELQKRDYPAIENLIESSFELDRYLSDEKVLAFMKHAYLQGCLAEQTFCRVAEQDGKVIGVIMGKADNRYQIRRHIQPFAATLWHSLRMEWTARRRRVCTRDYRRLHQIYRDFLKESPARYDGTLSLFAVDEKSRGFGVGTALLNALQAYYEDCGVKKIYLYTDSTCNTWYYERHGFQCAAERKLDMMQRNKPFRLNVYLYEKAFT